MILKDAHVVADRHFDATACVMMSGISSERLGLVYGLELLSAALLVGMPSSLKALDGSDAAKTNPEPSKT